MTNKLTKSQKLLYYLIQQKRCVDDKTKLAKYQYFSDFIHYAFNNQPISSPDVIYSKQKMGPLARTLTDDLAALESMGYVKETPKFHYNIVKDVDIDLSEKEKKTARYVLQKYGELNYEELVNICHNQSPYLSAQEGGIIEFFSAYNLVDEYKDYGEFC
jgi:uncharacterized phage-associated protein